MHRRDGQVNPSGVLVNLTPGRVARLVASQPDQIGDGVESDSGSKLVRQTLPGRLDALPEPSPEREAASAVAD
jgi:hypothetical protein